VFDATSPQPRHADELDVDAAFLYFEEGTSPPWSVPRSIFDLYLLYETLPSRKLEGRRYLRRPHLDAFLVRHPSGLFRALDEDDSALLSMRDAFCEYSQIDPQPVQFSAFRELVHAGILQAVYTSDAPGAPLVGIRRMALMAFLAARQRMAERRVEEARQEEEREGAKKISKMMTELLDARSLPRKPLKP
jgi:hypothetical protein